MSAQPKSFRSGELSVAALPVDASWLIGRDEAVAQVIELLVPGCIVTLTGAGGVGKTSVALEVARTLLRQTERFGDGIWFCAMGAVDSAPAIPVVIADSIGAPPTDEATPYDSIVTGLGGRRGVLIVDHCEQIVSPIASVLQQLVSDCPHLAVLVTSSEPLRLGAEQLVELEPLDVDLAAAELFVRRGTEADPHFERFGREAVILRVCAWLEGVPLAVELAAAHLATMTLNELDSRLGERFGERSIAKQRGRNDSLDATVSWSYDLLEPMERRLFDRLSVFRGGFDDRLAAAMLDPRDRERVDIRDLLSTLVARSLINIVGVDDSGTGAHRRYEMLETLRQFGDRQLGRHNERVTVRNQHLDLMVDVVAAANAYAMSNDWIEGARRFRREWSNIRAAVNWAIDTTRVDDVDRLLRDIHFYCRWTLESEATLWAQRAIERGPTTGVEVGAPAYLHLGFKHVLAGQHPAALDVFATGLTARGTPSDRVWCRYYAAVELAAVGRAAEAVEQASVDVDGGPPREVEAVMRSSSITAFQVSAQLTPTATAREYACRDVELAVATGNAVAVGHATYHRGLIEYSEGDLDAYIDSMDEVLDVARTNEIASLLSDGYAAQVSVPGRAGLRAALGALDFWTTRRDVGNEFVVLEAIGINLAELRRLEPAAVILGNVQSGRRTASSSRSRREAAVGEIARHRRGNAWMSMGAAMSRDEVLAFARSASLDALDTL